LNILYLVNNNSNMIDSTEKEMLQRPRNVVLSRLLINSIWVFASWFLWSIIVMAFLFLLSSTLGFNFDTDAWVGWVKDWYLFPFLFSLVVFLGTTITMLFTYFVLSFTNSDNYKKNMITFFQIIFFSVLIYIFMLPIYLYIWENFYDSIFLIFLLHNLIAFLLFSIVLELLNNYTHIFLGVYSSFLGTLITLLIVIKFWIFNHSKWKIFLIVLLVPLLNFLNYFVKQIIEMVYYQYYKYTWNDPIGNIFYQIEKEEKEDNL
jgi:hypothetical protein